MSVQLLLPRVVHRDSKQLPFVSNPCDACDQWHSITANMLPLALRTLLVRNQHHHRSCSVRLFLCCAGGMGLSVPKYVFDMAKPGARKARYAPKVVCGSSVPL